MDTINFLGDGKGAIVAIHSPVLGDISVRAAELNWSASSSLELATLFYAYCADAGNYLNATQIVTVQPDTLWLDASNGQDQMIPTPEPRTILLMGTGLLLAWRAAQRG